MTPEQGDGGYLHNRDQRKSTVSLFFMVAATVS
jgi:hypothetical protein